MAADTLIGARVVDLNGNYAGEVVDLYRDVANSIAILVKVKLPGSAGYGIVPTATATLSGNEIKAKVEIEKLGNSALRYGGSIVVSSTRVREVYRRHEVELPKSLHGVFPAASKATYRTQARRVTFPGDHLEGLVAGTHVPVERH
ncbi:hypothetical protein [Streptomyces sp. NPDC002845]